MNRDELIRQVKDEYANIISAESQQHFHQTTAETTAEEYYGKLMDAITLEINRGTFDHYPSGKQIFNAVAADKSLLSEWK